MATLRVVTLAFTCAAFACVETTSDRTPADTSDAGLDASAGTGGIAGVGGDSTGGAAGSAGMSGGAAGSAGTLPEAAIGCEPGSCQQATCQGKIYSCGDCLDNDGDGLFDALDPDCYGPCHNDEQSYASSLPDHNMSPCRDDCYFDNGDGSGDDDCYWSHRCDPLEVPPDYSPEGPVCAYAADAGVAGTSKSCAELMQSQSQLCTGSCLPVTPNGCDCFGCCQVPQAPTPIWLDSTDANANSTCDYAHLGDPSRCRPCTIVPSCFNPCEECELCLGKLTLPASCLGEQMCPGGVPRCGLPGQPCCPSGSYCVSGCCVPLQ